MLLAPVGPSVYVVPWKEIFCAPRSRPFDPSAPSSRLGRGRGVLFTTLIDIMAEHVIQSYGNNEELNIGFSNTNGGLSLFQYHSQWMAHWKRASSISTPQCHKHCTHISNKQDCVKEEGHQVENTKSLNVSMQELGDSWPSESSFQSIVRKNDTECVHHSLNKMSNFFIHNVGSLERHNTSNPVNFTNRRSQNLSSALHYWLTTKNMCLSEGEQLYEDSTETAKADDTALFEMLTVPTTPRFHGKKQRDSQLLINSSIDGIGNGTNTNETRKESSAKTDTIDIDGCRARSFPKGMMAERLQKDPARPSVLLVKQSVSRHATSSDKTGSTRNRELSTSRIESTNVDQTLSLVQKSNMSNSSGKIENSTQEERCDKWLKRLRHNPSDYFGLGTKRKKIDDPTSLEMRSLLSKVCNYSTPSSDMMKHPNEQQIFDSTNHLPKFPEHSYDLSVKVPRYWIQRWCHRNRRKAEAQASLVTPGLCEPENPKAVPENLERKQLPSIRAMALMGRVMNSLRTCEFQRKGSSVVWNLEDF